MPLGYVAWQTVICRPERPVTAGAVCTLAGVSWLAPFPSRAKLAPELLTAAGWSEVVVAPWSFIDGPALADRLHQVGAGVTVTRVEPRTVRARVAADRLPAIAGLDAVAWVQAPDSIEPLNSRVQWVMQTGWLPASPDPGGRRAWANGVRGQDEVTGLFDSGIITEHDQFRDPELPLLAPGVFPFHRKVAAYKLYPGAAFGDAGAAGYHGTGVAGTLCGNDSLCGNLSRDDGVAPDARLYFVDVGAANGLYVLDDDITELLDSVRLSNGMPAPVRQVIGGFGSNASLGYYRLLEASLDATCWNDQQFTAVWAAGNNGGSQYKIGHPGCAKNIITVGATENGTDSRELATFSSRGPTRDGRLKPLVVAPGRAVTTAYGPGFASYALRNGTSWSAPAVSGALTLVRQYFREGRYPFGTPDPNRSRPTLSSALLRAFSMLAADPEVEADSLPANDFGWGRFNLSRLLHFPDDTVAITFMDETLGLATGQFHEYRLLLTDRRPLRVALCWTDTAAAPAAEVAIVNDLDLELVSPDGNGYRGNQFLDGQSRANPQQWDERNVEEGCVLDLPLTGWWTIRVLARSVFTERQSYALAIQGGFAGQPGVLEALPSSPSKPQPTTQVLRAGQVLAIPALNKQWLQIITPDGRVIEQLAPDGDGVFRWRGAGRKAGAGIYFWRADPGGSCSGRLLLIP